MAFDFALIDGDLKLNSDGSLKTYNGLEKLRQDIVKIVITSAGALNYHPWYGTNLGQNLIGTDTSDSLLVNEITFSIQDSLSRLQQLQRAQATEQNVNLSEMIGNINEIRVQRSVVDPRLINVYVSVSSRAYENVEESFLLRS